MQQELSDTHPDLSIQLLAVNEIGYSSGLDTMSAMGDLPVLQDTVESGVWDAWGAGFRDVVILNAENEQVASFNLTTHSLAEPDNFASLKSLLVYSAE